MGGVPASVALVAGGLAVFNPCAFPLLPAFLSFYVGADEVRLPRTATRVAQGLLIGLLVTVGFLGVFTLIGLPIVLGAAAVADAVPWAGLATGVVLAVLGLLALAGVHVAIPQPFAVRPRRERRAGAIVLFGVGYGAASLGCTLPVFLALVGVSLGGAALTSFVAYGVGMAIVLMSVAVGAALLRDGLARCVRPLLPHAGRLGGALLVVSGGYLAYYWARIRFGDVSTLADDPVVGVVTRYAAEIESGAAGRAWLILAAGAAALVLATAFAFRRRRSLVFAGGLLAVGAVVLVLVFPGGRGTTTPASAGGPVDVRSVAHFQTLFNQASSDPRLVLILSPT